MRKSLFYIKTEKEIVVIKRVFAFVEMVQEQIPSLFTQVCAQLVELQASENKEIRYFSIGLLGKVVA